MKLLNKLVTISLFSSSLLFAVNVPNAGTISKDIQIPKNIKKNEKGLIEVDGIRKLTAPMKEDKSGRKVLVNDFDIVGNSKISIEKINTKIEKYKNTKLSFYDMQEVAHIITKLYRDKGYFLARAYIPKQDMSKGILKIIIIEGEFGSLNLDNKSRVKDSIIQGVLDNVKKQKVVSSSALERALLISNDLPGVYISQADVRAGQELGTSDFNIEAIQTSTYNGYILADNHGGRYSGKNRLLASATINSPFKIGDKLTVTGLQSEDAHLKYIDLSYNTLLLSNGLRGGIGYSYTGYKLGEEYEYLDAVGYSKDFNINLSYPIIRQRDESLFVNFNFDNKRIKDEIRNADLSSKKEINVASIALDYTYTSLINNLPSTTNLTATLSYGNLTFKDKDALENDMAGANTNGTYRKINIEASKTVGITNKLSLEGKLQYQHSLSNKNLDGSEDLSIGGTQGVKVYPTSEVSAENGYVATLEAKYVLPRIGSDYAHTVGVFYDRARAYMADDKNVDSEDRSIQDMGLSYYVTYKDFFLNSYAAWKVNSSDITSEPNYGSKILIQAGWVF